MKGGAIGVGVAGHAANVFMIWQDRKLNQMLKQSDIEVQLFSRYVDDIVIVAKIVKSNPGEPKGREAMRKIQEMANDIHESTGKEATYIHKKNPGLNAKEEWGNSNAPRTRFDQRSNELNLINDWQAIVSIH